MERITMRRITFCTTFVLLAAVTCGGPLHGNNDKQAQVSVFVFVGTDASGFTNPNRKDLNDSVTDLKNYLRSKVRLADKREDADVTVEVVSRALEFPARPNGDAAHEFKVPTVTVRLSAGNYSTTFDGQDNENRYWRVGAYDAAEKIETWVRDNHDKLIKERAASGK
jgi:hypothetical protein